MAPSLFFVCIRLALTVSLAYLLASSQSCWCTFWHTYSLGILTFLLSSSRPSCPLPFAVHIVPLHSPAFLCCSFFYFRIPLEVLQVPSQLDSRVSPSVILNSPIGTLTPNVPLTGSLTVYGTNLTLLQFPDTIIDLFLVTLYSLLALLDRPPHRPHGILTDSLTGTRTVLLALSLALSPGDHSQMSGLHPYGLRACHLH